MTKTNKISLVLASILLSNAAFANPYVSGQAGYNGYGFDGGNKPLTNLFDNDSDANGYTGRIAAGYEWHLNPCMKAGVEAGLTGYENANMDTALLSDGTFVPVNASYKRWDVDTLAVLDITAIQKLNLFAKAGVAFAHQRGEAELLGAEYRTTHHLVSPKGVVGVGYDVAQNVNFNVSMSHTFDRNHDEHYAPSATNVMAGLKYSFA